MSYLYIVIASGVLSSFITTLYFMLTNHSKHQERKKKAGVLFNQIKKNRPKHFKDLKNIFTNNNLDSKDIDNNINKLLNLEGQFFTEVLKSLVNENNYNINLIFRSYLELMTYTELLFSDIFSDKASYGVQKTNFKNNIVNNIKLDLFNSSKSKSFSINDIKEKFYSKKDIENISFLIDTDIADFEKYLVQQVNSNNDEQKTQDLIEMEDVLKEELTNTFPEFDETHEHQNERVLVTKNLTEELEKV